MKFTRNTQSTKAAVAISGLMLCLGVMVPEICAALDAYVVYSGKDYQKKESFLAGLSQEFSVKSFNIDRLRAGDYSQKQKALARFNQASAIVFLRDAPMKVLNGSSLSSDLIIVESILASVKSKARTFYVLSEDMDAAQLEQQLKNQNRTADVVRVKEETLDVIKAASLLTAKILKPEE